MAENIYAFKIHITDAGEASKQLNSIEVQLKKLAATRRDLQKQQQKGMQLTNAETKALELDRQETMRLNIEKGKLNRELRLQTQVQMSTKGSMERLRAETALMRIEANKLDLSTREGRARFKQMQIQIDANARSIRNFDRSLSGSSTLVGEYSRGIVTAFRSIAAGVLIAVGAIRTFTHLINNVAKAYADFERGQTNVQTLLDDFNDTLKGGTIQLMRQYGLEVENTNKALFDAVSASVPAGEAIAFMDTASKLAIAGVTDLGTTVDGLTSILNAYRLSYSETEEVASAFFSAQKFGKTTVAALTDQVGRAAPVANQLGVSYKELLSLYAELTKQGIKTEESTAAINGVFAGLLKPAKGAIKVFDDLGIAYGANAVKSEGFLNVFKQIIDAVEGGDVELAKLFPRLRALVGAGALGSPQWEDFLHILETVNTDFGEGGSMMRGYQMQMETLQKSLDRIKSKFVENKIAVGEFIAPAIKGFADLISPMRTMTDNVTDEMIALQNLGTDLKDNWDDEEARRKVLDQINTQYPNLLAGMNLESASLDDIKNKLREANTEYINRIVLLKQQDRIDKESKKVARDKFKEVQRERDLQRSIAETAAELGVLTADLTGDYGDQVEQLSKLAREQEKYDELINPLFKKGLLTFWGRYQTELEDTWDQQQILNDVEKEANEIAKTLFGTIEDGQEPMTEYQKILKDLSDGTLTFAEAQEKLIKLTQKSTGEKGTPTVVVPPEDTGTEEVDKKAQKHAEQVADERMALFEKIRDIQIAMIQDVAEQEKAQADEDLAREEERLVKMRTEYPELKEEINATIEALEEEHQQKLNDIDKKYRDINAKAEEQARQKKKEEDEKAAEETRNQRIKDTQTWLKAASEAITALANLTEANKQRELSAAGQNEEKREAIERKYFQKQKKWAIAQALINGALAVTNMIATVPGSVINPATWVGIAIAAASTLAQVAIIARQKFKRGGLVQPGYELPGFSRTNDNTLILARPGEAVVTPTQQIALGGPEAFKAAGVPGFQEGGLLPTPSTSQLDSSYLTNMVLAGLNAQKIYLNVNELNDANRQIDYVKESPGL